MLLAIDIGNTNTVFGVFDDETLVKTLRVETGAINTGDLKKDLPLSGVQEVILGSVVPDANQAIIDFARALTDKDPVIVSPENVAIEIDLDKPQEIGADRLINAAAVLTYYKTPAVVVDFGTATTFDVIDRRGHYVGGVIAPGIRLSLAALHEATAKLPEIAVARPDSVIGRATIPAMQSGIYWGYISLIEGIIERIKGEMGEAPYVLATGGLAPLFSDSTPVIEQVDEHLTLKGLLAIYKNREAHKE